MLFSWKILWFFHAKYWVVSFLVKDLSCWRFACLKRQGDMSNDHRCEVFGVLSSRIFAKKNAEHLSRDLKEIQWNLQLVLLSKLVLSLTFNCIRPIWFLFPLNSYLQLFFYSLLFLTSHTDLLCFQFATCKNDASHVFFNYTCIFI